MEVIRIQRTPSRSSTNRARATIREQRSVNQRIRSCSDDVLRVEQALSSVFGRVTMANLANLAELCSTATNGEVQPDRLARRHRQAMLCFFCTHWDIACQVLLRDVLPSRMPNVPEVASPDRDPDPLSLATLLNR
jgi:hypothetical protein